MEMWYMIVLTVALAIGGLYFFYLRPNSRVYSKQLIDLADFNLVICNGAGELDAQLSSYMVMEQNNAQARVFLSERSFLKPGTADPYDSGENIMENALRKLDPASPAFAGVEQIVMMALPPDQMANCLLFATENAITHAGGVAAEGLNILKDTLISGVQNLHDPEVIRECLHQFGHAMVQVFNSPIAAHGLGTAIGNLEGLKIFTSFVNVNSLAQGLNPAFHFGEHGHQVVHAVTSHVKHSVHAIVDHAHLTHHLVPGAHFPFVTIFISSVKEIRLLNENKTSIQTSLKHIALDGAGAAAGAGIGGKTGAVIGTVIFPGVGTAVGAVLGAVLGGWGGRKITDKYKYRNLNEALNDYDSICQRMLVATHNAGGSCLVSISSLAEEEKAAFEVHIALGPVCPSVQDYINPILSKLINEQQIQIRSLKNKLRYMENSPFAMLSKNKQLIASIKFKISALDSSLPTLDQVKVDPVMAMRKLLTAKVIPSTEYSGLINASITATEESNKDLASALMSWLMDAAQKYNASILKIKDEYEKQVLVFNEVCAGWVAPVKGKEQRVLSEKDKLGLT